MKSLSDLINEMYSYVHENDVAKQNLAKTQAAVKSQEYSNIGRNLAGSQVAFSNVKGIGTHSQQMKQFDRNFERGRQAGDYGLGATLGGFEKMGKAAQGISKTSDLTSKSSQSTLNKTLDAAPSDSDLQKAKQDAKSTENRVRQLSNRNNVPGNPKYTSHNPSVIPRAEYEKGSSEDRRGLSAAMASRQK